MKLTKLSNTLVLATVLLATSAFAATKASLTLNGAANVNGTTLKAGEYSLQWDGTGNVEVSILHGKNVVAKVPAKVVDLTSPSQYDIAVITKNSDGSSTLSGARFEGKKYALDLGDAGSGMAEGSSK